MNNSTHHRVQMDHLLVTLTTTDLHVAHISCDESRGNSDYFHLPFTVTFATLLILIAIVTIPGNAMVIMVVVMNRKVREYNRSINLFLCNLAFADLFVGLFNIPFTVHTLIHECWDFPRWFCTMNSFVMTFFYCVSLHTLMYIGLYKYCSIRRIHRNIFSPLPKIVSYLMILASWLWGFFLALMSTVVLSKSIYKPKTTQCGPQYPEYEDSSFILHSFNQLLGIFVPLGILVFAYVSVFMYIRHNNNERRRLSLRNQTRHGQTTVHMDERGVVKTLIIVLACFLLCWTPYVVYTNLATFTEDKSKLPYYLNPLAYCFGFLNSACNPIIYAWRFPDFRRGYWKIIKKATSIVSFERSNALR